MNGGEPANKEICFPQYTPYHGLKSQNWGMHTPLLLDSKTSPVSEDGAYLFSKSTNTYTRINDTDVPSKVSPNAMPPDRIGVPTVTFVSIAFACLAVLFFIDSYP